jgi:hypothetical protein
VTTLTHSNTSPPSCPQPIQIPTRAPRGSGGGDLDVVTGFQTRDGNACVTWVSSVELFSDTSHTRTSRFLRPSSFPNVIPLASSSPDILLFLVETSPGMNRFRATSPVGRSRKISCFALTAPTHRHRDETVPRDNYTINDNIVRRLPLPCQ